MPKQARFQFVDLAGPSDLIDTERRLTQKVPKVPLNVKSFKTLNSPLLRAENYFKTERLGSRVRWPHSLQAFAGSAWTV